MDSDGLMTPGQHLYCQWVGSTLSDEAHYWRLMNPAGKRAWERLAREQKSQLNVYERRERAVGELLDLILNPTPLEQVDRYSRIQVKAREIREGTP